MEANKTVLVVGATGMLGHAIARELLRHPGCTVRTLIRPGGYDGGKAKQIDQLEGLGATMVEGDLLKPTSLAPACEGADVVISAVQGGERVVVDGQHNLIEAAERAGVPRVIPSDFSVDLHKLDLDDHVWLAHRKRAHEAFAGRSVQPTSVLIGAFMMTVLAPQIGPVDWEAGTFTYWGDGEQPCDYTSVPDTARYTAAAALDDNMAGRPLRVAGDVLTMKQLHTLFEDASGQPLDLHRAGSVEDLRTHIEQAKQENPSDQMAYAFDQYTWAMQSGRAKLDTLDNDRYPDIEPVSMRAFLKEQLSRNGTA